MNKLLAGGLVASALLIGAVDSAQAAFKLKLTTSGGAMTVITDDGPGDGAFTTPGIINNLSLTLDGFDIVVSTSQSKPITGASDDPSMTLQVIATSSGAAGTLTVEATDTDFTAGSNLDLILASTINQGSASDTGSIAYWADFTNTEFGKGVQLGSTVATTGGVAALTESINQAVAASPFSLTIVSTITHTASGTSNVDGQLKVMEPGTLASIGFGLLALGLYRNRRRA